MHRYQAFLYSMTSSYCSIQSLNKHKTIAFWLTTGSDIITTLADWFMWCIAVDTEVLNLQVKQKLTKAAKMLQKTSMSGEAKHRLKQKNSPAAVIYTKGEVQMKFLLQVSESCMQAYFQVPLMKLQPMKVSRISSFAFAVYQWTDGRSCCCKNCSRADGASMFPWNVFVAHAKCNIAAYSYPVRDKSARGE